MHRSLVGWGFFVSVALALACGGSGSTPEPEPEPSDPVVEPTPAPAPGGAAADGVWALEGLTLAYDPSTGLVSGETQPHADINMKVLGDAVLTGGAEVEVRTWHPPFQSDPPEEPFAQSADDAKKAAGAYLRACKEATVDHLVKETKDPSVGTIQELDAHGLMWDGLDYAVMLHHIWTFRNPADLCVVAWVGSEGQDYFVGPKIHVMVGRADQRFVAIVEQDISKSELFAPLQGKSLKEQFAAAPALAKKAWDSPDVANVRKFVETLSVK